MIKNISVFCLCSFVAVCAFTQSAPKKVFKPNTTSLSDSVASLKRGKALYATYCLTCHQGDGGGVPNLNPPLIQTSFVTGKKDPLIKIILKGLNTHMDIDGESYSNNMPPFEWLKDQQIADILSYIRNNFGNKKSIVVKTEVQKVRSNLKK
ncbi:MAG: c-type cytochrome [Ginsengibacter sp.]